MTSKYRSILTNSTYLLLANTASMGFSLVAGLVLVRALVPEQYGMVAYFLKLFGLARFIGTLGLGAKVIEDVSGNLELGRIDGVGQVVWTLGVLRLVSGCALLLALAVVAVARADVAFVWAGTASLFASLGDFASAVTQALRRPREVALLAMVQPVLYLLYTSAAWASRRATVSGIYAAFSCAFIPTLVCFALLLRRGPVPGLQREFVSSQYLRKSRKSLSALLAFGLLNYLFLSLGTLALGEARLFEDAAYLNAALTIVTLPAALGLLVATGVLYPDAAAASARGDRDGAARMVDIFLKAGVIVLALPTAAVAAYSGAVVRLLYTDTYVQSSRVLTVLAPLALLLFLQQLLTFGFYAVGRADLASRGMAVQVLVVVCGLFLVTRMARLPAALTLAAVYSVAGLAGAAIHWADLRRVLPFRLSMVRVALSFGVCLGIVGGARMTLALVSSGLGLLGHVTHAVLVAAVSLGCTLLIVLDAHDRRRLRRSLEGLRSQG